MLCGCFCSLQFIGGVVNNFFSMSPLEQFNIIPIFYTPFFVVTNSFFTLMLIFIGFYQFLYAGKNNEFIPTRFQTTVELLYSTAFELAYVNIGRQGLLFFPLIFSLFLFLFEFNLIGMIPYSFTITSHLIITFALALTVFIGFNIIGIRKHRISFLGLLLPAGASLALVPLLVPIEFVSYMFRVISLPVRLFANMMAGHTLLKVIAGFAWLMVNSGGLLAFIHIVPLGLLIILIGLELGVAIIQSYVFTILTCMYINDALNLH